MFTRNIKSYIAETVESFKSMVLGGLPHDPVTLELARMQGMERGLIEGEIDALASRMLGTLDNATCEEIESRGALLRIPRRAATKSRGIAIINGFAGNTIPSSLALNIQGKSFILDTSGDFQPTVIGVDGTAKVSIIAVSEGSTSNLSGQGYLDTNITGIMSLVKEVFTSGGVDEEDCKTEYKARVLYGETLASPVGSAPWYALRALRYPSVTKACVSSCGCCATDLDVFIFAAGFTNNIPDATFLSNIQEKVYNVYYGATELGSRNLGVKITARAARLAPLKIIVNSDSFYNGSSRSLINNETNQFINNSCVGGSYCKGDFVSILKSFGGCAGKVTFEYNKGDFTETDSHLNAECDVFPVITEILYVC